MLAVVTLVALLGSLLVVVSQPMPAQAAVTGTGGQYVPMPSNARVLGGATEKGVFRTVQVAGVAGLPSSGIGAVTMMVTIADPSGSGQLQMRADASDTTTLMMIYNSGVGGNTSNTGLLALADDGTIQVRTETAQSKVVIDVTGYYTSTKNGVSAGGFVAMSPSRVLDSRGGIGAAQGQIPAGSQRTIQATGSNGIPAGAAAVAVNIIVINREAKAGYVRPTPTGETRSTGVLNYNSNEGQTTAMNAQVALSADGRFSIDTAAEGGKIDLVVDIQGYFLKSNPGGGFTPLNGRLIDTRNGSSIASGASFTVQVGGVQGAPTVEGGLSAVAVTFTAVNDSGADSYAKMWADGAAEPESSAISSDRTSKVTNTVVAPVGANGKIRIKNMGTGAMNYLVDLQGAYNSLPGGPGKTNRTGQRTSATTLPFPITDQTNASVDVGTGNLLVTTTAMSLPGVTENTTIGAAYNSRSTTVGDVNTMDANRWQYALAGAGNLTANADGVIYTDAVGTAWQFRPSGAQGAFISPAGLQQTLTRVTPSGQDTHYQLKGWTTNQTTVFNLAGQPTKVKDRNGNITDFTFATSDRYKLTSLVSTAGTAAQKTAASSYANGTQTFTQGTGSSSRSVSWAKNANGDIATYTDATGKQTTFGYTDGDLTSITAPEGGVTAFTYDSSDRITKVEQRNTTAGSPGTAVTRFSFKDDTTTLVADPRSDQSAAVADAKHTAYTLDGNDLVKKTIDPLGRERSKTYNSANNGVATSQVGASDAEGTGVSTNKYDKNNSQSLTSSQSGSGSTSSIEYGSTSAAATYLPSKVTGSSSSSTSMEYDDYGNQTSSQSGEVAGSKATLDYNDDGTVRQATAPGNSGNPTKYGYTNKQLTKVTAPTQTMNGEAKPIVGDKVYSYDAYGRVQTETDGRNTTTTFGYDNNDRLLTTAFDDGTATVTNTYDGNGNLITETSATGTITNTYDQRNRLTSTVNTAGGGTVSYGYDLAGNTLRVTDAQGTVTHGYDSSGALTTTTYPTAAGTAKQLYKTDSNSGRRTDIWLNAVENADTSKDPEVWEAHQHLSYDDSGKITRVQAWGDQNRAKAIIDTTYCYIAGTTAGGSCDADSTNDRDKLQWAKDNTTDQITSYGYKSDDDAETNRLTSVEQTGGTGAMNWKFTYDDAGNRTRAKATDVASGDVATDTELRFNAIGQITNTGYQYDSTGNLTAAPGETFTYNGAQQMTASTKNGVTTRYTYAGASMVKLLSQATEGGSAYQYTYGKSGTMTARTVAGLGAASVLNDPSSGRPLDLRTTDGTTSMWVLDGIGNPTAAVTDSGAEAYTVSYSPYGKEAVSAGDDTSIQWKQNPYGFKAGIRSSSAENGLTKFGYRWQSDYTGAWTARDTLDAPLDPSNANRYAYAGGDPLNGSDPSGRAYVGFTGEACAFVCAQVGVGYDGDWDLTLGAAAGPDIGLTGVVGGGFGTNEGPSVNGSCSAEVGPGVYGEVGVGEGGDLSGGGGIGAGLGAGCNVGVSYTF